MRVTGIELSHLLGRNFADLIAVVDREVFLTTFRAVRPGRHSVAVLASDGRPVALDVWLTLNGNSVLLSAQIAEVSAEPDSPVGRIRLDLTVPCVLSCDRAFEAILGWPEEHLTRLRGARLAAMVHADDRATIVAKAVEMANARDGAAIKAEYRCRQSGGRWRWIQGEYWVAERDASGRPTIAEGTACDVTELRESDAAYRLLFDANPNPMWIYDVETLRFLQANNAAVATYGYSHEEFQTMTLLDIRPPDEVGQLRIAAAQPELSRGVTWTHIKKSGEHILAEVTSCNLTFLGRRSRLVLVQDVTERKEAEALLRRTEQALTAVLASAPCGIVAVDLDGSIGSFNPEAERIFGRPASEVIGLHLSALTGRRSALLTKVTAEIVSGNGVRNKALTIRRKDGGVVAIEITSSPIVQADGQRIGATAILTDITERKETRRQLQQLNSDLERLVAERTAELTMANQELEAFCFSVSHDLRAPLRAIDGFSRAVLSDMDETLPAASRNHLHRVRSASQRMSSLIDALLSLTRLTRLEITRVSCDMTEIAEQSLSDLMVADPDRNVTVRIQQGLRAYGDPRLLRLLLDNLFANALKFTSKVENPSIEFAQEAAAFVVRDNGAGFDMAFSSRLFKPFERLHANSEFAGNGIGLATAHRIVTRHGGTIGATGALDQGATISFTLGEGPEADVA